MRSPLFLIWAGIRWILLMFVITQTLEAPLIAHANQPLKPIRVWSGVTSWYGSQFHGRTTASGTKFNMFELTAASPDLPLGSLLRVSNPKTHIGQLVRVTDRGPFEGDRDLDVSYLVACRLGIVARGSLPLRIELLELPYRH